MILYNNLFNSPSIFVNMNRKRVDFITASDALAELAIQHFCILGEGNHYHFDASDPDETPHHRFFDLSRKEVKSFLARQQPSHAEYIIMNSAKHEELYFDSGKRRIRSN